MTKDEALNLARSCILASLEYKQGKATAVEAVQDIDVVLAQPEQKPVAYRSRLATGSYTYCNTPQFFDNAEPLYVTPPAAYQGMTIDASAPIFMTPHPAFAKNPAAQRKPLTDEQIITAYETSGHKQSIRPQDVFAVASLARAIEAAHGIKGNT